MRVREDKDTKSQASTGTLGAADDGRFWMLFKDFFQFFFNVTISYTRDDFHITRIAEEIPDEQWGVSRLVIPKDTPMAFISLFQMNQKFFDPAEDNLDELTMKDVEGADTLLGKMAAIVINDQVEKENEEKHADDPAYQDFTEGVKKPEGQIDSRDQFAQKDLEYPKLELIVCRRGKLVPEKDQPPCDDEVIAYLDGVECEEPCATIRLNNMRKGEYYILYKPDFKDFHKVRRLNLVFYSEF